jgi:hypothetical protein
MTTPPVSEPTKENELSDKYYLYQSERGMNGPHVLDVSTIQEVFPDPKVKPYGVYLLIRQLKDGSNVVVYVGRGIIRDRLTEHVTGKDAGSFYFKALIDNDDIGFAEECRLFHLYGKRPHLDNEKHPDVPDGAPKNHPKCAIRGCNGDPD